MRSCSALTLRFLLLFAVSATMATAGFCDANRCESDKHCLKGGCYRLDISLNGRSLIDIRECHAARSGDRYLQNLLRVPPANRPDEVLSIVALGGDERGSLVIAFSYCSPLPPWSPERSLHYSAIGDTGNCTWSYNTRKPTVFGWKSDGRQIGIEATCPYEYRRSDHCSELFGKTSFQESPTLCEWYSYTKQNLTSEILEFGKETVIAWYGTLSSVLLVVFIVTPAIGVYEIVRFRKQKRRPQPGIGFGDAASIGKPTKSHGSKKAELTDRASIVSKDSILSKEPLSWNA